MARTPSLALLFASLILAGLLAPGAAANQEQADEDWQRDDRNLTLDHQPHRARLASERDSPLGTDRVEVDYHRDDARIVHRFITAGGETATSLSVRLASLIEHIPEAGAHFGPGAETVQRHRIGDLVGEALAIEDVQGNGYRIIAKYSIPDRRDAEGSVPGGLTAGTLTLTLTMLEHRRAMDGKTLDPTQLLLDVRIDRHPFHHTDTHLALEYEIAADRPLASADATRDAILITTTPYESYLEWGDTARTGVQEAPVAVTLLSHLDATGGEAAQLYVSMPQAILLQHEQTLGTMRLAEIPTAILDKVARGDALVYGAVLLVTLVAVGTPIVRRLKEE